MAGEEVGGVEQNGTSDGILVYGDKYEGCPIYIVPQLNIFTFRHPVFRKLASVGSIIWGFCRRKSAQSAIKIPDTPRIAQRHLPRGRHLS
jgi:hypothetical protein